MSASGRKNQMTQLSAELRSIKQALAPLRQSVQTKKNKKKPQPKGGTNIGKSYGAFRDLPTARAFGGMMSRFSTSNLPRHKVHGDGVRIIGCEAAVNITTDAAFGYFFAGLVATTANNSFPVSPDIFNGRLALIARTYTKFRFRKLIAHFVPNRGTTNVGIGVVGYIQDASLSFVGSSFANLTQTVPSKVFSLNAPCSIPLVDYRGDEVFYGEYSSSTDANVRMTAQGMVLGFPNQPDLGALNHGILWLEYELELYGPVMDYGYSVSVKDADEREAMQKALATYRRTKSSDDDWETESVRSGRSRR